LLGATAVGFLAPPISGDTVGILFSAQVGVLATPLMAFFGVAIGAALVSAPVWVLLRRHQARREPATETSG
jgi:Amt family ammonium transporter